MHLIPLLSSLLLLAQPQLATADLTRPTTDFSAPETRERFPAGTATVRTRPDSSAFSHPSANLREAHALDFTVGKGFFRRLWVTAPSSTEASDGLGPLYNARSCQRCHVGNGRGHLPDGPEDNAVSLVLKVDIPPQTKAQRAQREQRRRNNIPDPVYGLQLQDFAIAGHRAEYRLGVETEEHPVVLADGTEVNLRRPVFTPGQLAFGPLHPEARMSPRVAPPMIGLGLLEAIPEEDILALADPGDHDGDGISGRPNRVWDIAADRVALGRFGLKAGSPTIGQQSQEAFHIDIGMSVPLFPAAHGDCTAAQRACRQAPDGNSPQYDDLEANPEVVDLVSLYAANLGVPVRRDVGDPEVLAGKRLFYETGCIACHTPKFVTRRDGVPPEQAAELIWPYTDLLLHDMGEGLADNRPEGLANGREWRTPPLWGIGLTQRIDPKAGYLHDGRARSLLEAILWHGGEAQGQRDAVIAMAADDRARLIRFLESL